MNTDIQEIAATFQLLVINRNRTGGLYLLDTDAEGYTQSLFGTAFRNREGLFFQGATNRHPVTSTDMFCERLATYLAETIANNHQGEVELLVKQNYQDLGHLARLHWQIVAGDISLG